MVLSAIRDHEEKACSLWVFQEMGFFLNALVLYDRMDTLACHWEEIEIPMFPKTHISRDDTQLLVWEPTHFNTGTKTERGIF